MFLATKAFPCDSYSYEHLSAALEGSLCRLRTDRIDLYQLHGREDWVFPYGPTPVEELADTLNRLRQSGKVVHVGVSNLPVELLDALAARCPIFSTQNPYSLLDRGAEPDALHLAVESEILPYAQGHDIAVLAYSPLSRGLLAEGLDPRTTFPEDDERHVLPRYQPGIYPHYVALADRLTAGRTSTARRCRASRSRGRAARLTATIVGRSAPSSARRGRRRRAAADGAELRELDELVGTLPDAARAAKMVVMDDSSADSHRWMRERRGEGRPAPV